MKKSFCKSGAYFCYEMYPQKGLLIHTCLLIWQISYHEHCTEPNNSYSNIYWYIHTRSLVLYMNPWDSIAILIEISWGIYWPTLYLPNLCKSLLQEPKTFDIKTIFARPVVAAQLSSQQQTFKNKWIKLLMKYAIVIGWCSNELERFGKYKVDQ